MIKYICNIYSKGAMYVNATIERTSICIAGGNTVILKRRWIVTSTTEDAYANKMILAMRN